jgi:hypothetical protein
MPHQRRDRSKPPEFAVNHGELVHVAGTPIAFAAEVDPVPDNIDHFWITISIGHHESLRIALSTRSRQNAVAGFDPRLRVGVITSNWQELPPAGVTTSPGLNYADIEAKADSPVTFVEHERPALEKLLEEKCTRAIFIEAWGEFYFRKERGIHQVHSRRASCSVPKDEIGKDGAIRFFFGHDATAELLLFKYCGQP